MKADSSTTPLSKVLCLVIAGMVALCAGSARAQDDRSVGQFGLSQDDTSARTIGQASPGFIPSYPLQSDALRREQQQSQSVTGQSASPAASDGKEPLTPEGAEELAWESMHPKRFDWELSVLTGWEYDDNPYLSGTGADGKQTVQRGGVNSYYARIPLTIKYSGGLMNFNASYVPEYRVYDGDGINNTFNQAANIVANYADEKLQVGLNVNLAQTEDGNVEVGDRVQAFVMLTALTASYAVSSRSSVGASLSFNDDDYHSYDSYKRYAAEVFSDYKIAPRTQIGLGVGYDQTTVQEGADSGAVNVSGRVNWQVTDKIALRGSAGCEWRKFDDTTIAASSQLTNPTVTTLPGSSSNGSGNRMVSPVFDFGTYYAVSDHTSLSLDGYRRSNPSISEIDQSYYSTGAVATITQKLFDRFSFSLGVGYENADYQASVTGILADRTDNYCYVRPQLMYTIGRQLTLGTYYQYSRNESSGGDGVNFNRNTVGGTFTYNF